MREKRGSFEPKRLKRAVKRLDYVARWIDEEFGEKRELNRSEINTKSENGGFLSKLLKMLKSGSRV